MGLALPGLARSGRKILVRYIGATRLVWRVWVIISGVTKYNISIYIIFMKSMKSNKQDLYMYIQWQIYVYMC